MYASLNGLSVGDAFGERFFGPVDVVRKATARRVLPAGPWRYTDDTVMALSVVTVLERYGRLDQDALAAEFSRRYLKDPARGYGGGAHEILGAIARGESWRSAGGRAFGGTGSMGNGGAMRAGPLGAFLAEDIQAAVEQADKSAAITHAHPEGRAGAIAVAAAAAWATSRTENGREDLFDFVLAHVPEGAVANRISQAQEMRCTSATEAASVLGCGERVLAEDTVPFCLWVAAEHFLDFEEALWITVSCMGDRDTTCAIVGSIVALSVGREGIPRKWIDTREPLENMM